MGPLDLLLLPVRTAVAVTMLPERLDRLSEGLDAVRDDASAMRRQFEEVARVVDRLAGDVAPMDEDLADQMVQGASTGQMWRTAPLWGLRVKKKYMHDGRANDLDDAIVMHGGEAEKVRDQYKALNPSEKDAVRAFLTSL